MAEKQTGHEQLEERLVDKIRKRTAMYLGSTEFFGFVNYLVCAFFVEAAFVFQSWSENQIWSFANKGRVPDGGTHEAGMLDAIGQLEHGQASSSVGILAVLAIEYPQVTFEGCIKARIGNPELRRRVADLVSTGLKRWSQENPDEVEYLKTIERFQFADIW